MTVTGRPSDISPTHLEIIQHTLNVHVPDLEVRAFGSRAKWNTKIDNILSRVVANVKTRTRLPLNVIYCS